LKILYVTSNGGIHDYRFLKKLTEDYEVLLLHYSAKDIIKEIREIKGLNIISKKPLIGSFPYLSERKHFRKTYEDFKPDITHTGYVWQVGVLASSFNVHPHLSMVWGSDVLLEPDKWWFYKKLVRKVLHQADHIQCDAEFVKQKILDDYGLNEDKVTVFPWGIDLNLFKPMDKVSCRKKLNLDRDKFIIIFNRHLEAVYGLDNLLEGFRIFCRNKNDVLLLLLSDGILKDYVEKFISENDLRTKIFLIGRVANSELPLFLNASDVYISTSISDGSSLSLLEAMACGIAPVLTDLPAIKEWVPEENALLIPCGDSYSISDALEEYYNNRPLMETHSKSNIRTAAERADWDKNYLKLKEIYQKLI
jgi:glycosyltransferase involved in cell wall biosynthesis